MKRYEKKYGGIAKGSYGILRFAALLSLLLLVSVGLLLAGEDEVEEYDVNIWWSVKRRELTVMNDPMHAALRLNVTAKLNLVKYNDSTKSMVYIFNFDNNIFTLSKYRSKTVAEGTFDELRKLFKEKRKAEAAKLEKIEKDLKKYKGEIRQKRTEYLKRQKALLKYTNIDLKARPKKNSKIIAIKNYEAQEVEIFAGEKKVAGVWLEVDSPGPPKRWKNFIELMAELEPERWKPVLAAGGIPLRVQFDYEGLNLKWELTRVSFRGVSISNFFLSDKYKVVEPSLD